MSVATAGPKTPAELGVTVSEEGTRPSEVIAQTFREQAARLPEGQLRDLALRSATRWDAVPVDEEEAEPVDVPDDEQRRAMTIAYTALWQLRKTFCDASSDYQEPPVLFEARVDLRRRLDAFNKAATTVSLERKERNLIARELYRYLPAEIARVEFYGGRVTTAGLAVAGRMYALFAVLGGEKKIGRKQARDRGWSSWEVDFDTFRSGVNHLTERLRDDEMTLLDIIDSVGTGPAEEAKVRKRLGKVQEALRGVTELQGKWSHLEGLQEGRS